MGVLLTNAFAFLVGTAATPLLLSAEASPTLSTGVNEVRGGVSWKKLVGVVLVLLGVIIVCSAERKNKRKNESAPVKKVD